MNNIEIERKWLLDEFPKLPVCQKTEQEQGYLSFEPNTVRIRKTTNAEGTNYVLCIKGGGTLQRTEVEVELDAGQYSSLLGLLAAPPARKQHRTYLLDGGTMLECSLVDEGEPTSFYYAEVEFASVEEALQFKAPAFLGRDVTEERGWNMAAYCKSKSARQ